MQTCALLLFPFMQLFFFSLLGLDLFSPTGIFCEAFTVNFYMLLAVVVSQALLELPRIAPVFSVII